MMAYIHDGRGFFLMGLMGWMFHENPTVLFDIGEPEVFSL
jgi:hypothetical protein